MSNAQAPSSLNFLRRKTAGSLLRAWREVQSAARHVIRRDVRPHLPKEDLKLLKEQMELCLDPPGGEVSARAHTAELGRIYLSLNEEARERFLLLLAGEFDIDHAGVSALAKRYMSAALDEDKLALEIDLRKALEAPRSAILKQFTALPDGFKFLVNMRADLLPLLSGNAKLKALECDLKAILSAWFDVGLLDLVEITWKSPAALLEKLIEYEAVHRINSWEDLKNRLDSDRRVFAFFHNKMPLEPLIFVHIAFTKGMSDNIQQLLDQHTPVFDIDQADTAIFYSISNAQKGLTGISFGNFLIKRVVSQLTQEMPQIKTFATLSPIPGFGAWLKEHLARNPSEAKLFSGGAADWVATDALKPELMRLCAHYLLHEKRAGKPMDPVANFHLFNGARLERLNWRGDVSAKGLAQSAAIMVNYHYKLDEIDDNHESFVQSGKIVASRSVRGYL